MCGSCIYRTNFTPIKRPSASTATATSNTMRLPPGPTGPRWKPAITVTRRIRGPRHATSATRSISFPGKKKKLLDFPALIFHPSSCRREILLACLTFNLCFGDESLDWARGRRRDSRKHRPGSLFSAAEPTAFPEGEAEGLRPRPILWKDQRLVISRSASRPRAPAEALKHLVPLGTGKSEGGGGNPLIYRTPSFCYDPSGFGREEVLSCLHRFRVKVKV